jgi:hypothetical protein
MLCSAYVFANLLFFPRYGRNLAAFRVACHGPSSASHFGPAFKLAAPRRPIDFTKTQFFSRALRILLSNSGSPAKREIDPQRPHNRMLTVLQDAHTMNRSRDIPPHTATSPCFNVYLESVSR